VTGVAGTSGTMTGAAGSAGSKPVACGGQTCALGDSCCVQAVAGVRTEMCIPPGSTGTGGGSVGCTAGSCSGGRLCCLSLVAMATACATAAECADGVSTVLCNGSSDCPADRRFCCPAIGINICRPYGCPRN
jgi:hypothetical protein